ncbi:CASC3/Barentsz eIF4AIII binding-domain-containing protein [Annulohypoxylon truncatum]|uniref:CASC3/Barentsz eIF4AIII binding-domain-containing protein n=1 Tax=Annulohypoxylon truncatum TaxID=327061 RepID=UPI002008711F|nr:CASC3/Barentsz eIF4AIII binding-domain-containing protein [Annulohypoxylon truncatum]KAI1207123.1 CASC3/Barentsz eIF4AIII binding-domain-containing protein [Annulohypoxylon truncatum]
MVAAVRRRKMIGHRRRVEDEGEEDGGLDQLDIDDDSLTDGSLASEDPDPADDSDTSNVDEASPTTPAAPKLTSQVANGNGNVKRAQSKSSGSPPTKNPRKPTQNAVSDTAFMLNNLSIESGATPVQVLSFDESTEPPSRSSAPIVVSSNSATTATDHPHDAPVDRRRKEHEEYRRKRDEDPSFVPNRGSFFMHDHRHAGPSANGFRPFGRGPRGRGRGGIGGPFAPINHQMHSPADPTTNGPWAHDMHEIVAHPIHVRQPRPSFTDDGPPNGDGFIPTCPPSSTPINRTMATEKHVGNVQIRVFFPGVKEPIIFSGIQVRQYTKLPDHRPPLRRDKPVRISLPDFPPRYIFPATDRSFIFIPRAMRPNQRLRGKPRSGLGSIGGFSRRTSVFGGSVYAGSAYTPSVALSRRSSIAPDLGRDYLVSPTGSTMSRPPLPYDASRPVVRLPPQARAEQQLPAVDGAPAEGAGAGQPNMNDPAAHMQHPVQKPIFQENRPVPLPMHQPRPQKAVSVAGIESPEMHQNPSQPYQQAFHQQVPVQVSTSLGQESHVRHPSYPSQHSTGTPLSQIPERAIHAAPFQPNQFTQQNYYQPYQMMQPQQGYYYPSAPYPGSLPSSAGAPTFMPGTQQGQPQSETPTSQPNGQGNPSSNLVAQEVNGMVYYYDASQLPPMATYPYPAPQGYPMPGGVVGMNGMVTPSPDGYYYPPSGPGVVYYPQ